MPTGHCYCGKIMIEYVDKPIRAAICHCSNCKHYTSSMFSHNLVIPTQKFKVTGTPKKYSVIADSGRTVTNCFCGDCGTTLYRYRDGGSDPVRIVQAGVLDDMSALNAIKPELEMFIESRVDWIRSMESDSVMQFKGMPPPVPQ